VRGKSKERGRRGNGDGRGTDNWQCKDKGRRWRIGRRDTMVLMGIWFWTWGRLVTALGR
jgi:hypothetical protein